MTETENNDPGWLTIREYAAKYNLRRETLQGWVNNRYIDAEKRPQNHHSHGNILVWKIIDKPPKEHRCFQENYPKFKKVPFLENSIEERKEMLKSYLQIFLKGSNPSKDKFTQSDLAVILSIPPRQVKTWQTWGLPKSNFRGKKEIWPYPTYFARQDIVDFLGGEWDKLRQKVGGLTDAGEAPSTASVATEEGYFVYNPESVYPLTYDGFIRWLREKEIHREDRVTKKWVLITPENLLPQETEFFQNALKTREDGSFQYQYVCTSRPRGEQKSFDVMLLFVFRFFNGFRERIVLAANSKEQVEFIQFDQAINTIQHSPRLLATPGLLIQKKEIVLLEGKDKEFAKIVPVGVGQGLLPNTTCVVFTEICDLQDEEFYSQLSGSIRGIPNAWVLIDSTVAPKNHPFWRLHQSYLKGDPIIYFQHYEDKWYNPNTTKEFLQTQQNTLLATIYAKYFRNRWEDAVDAVFPANKIIEMGYAGIKGQEFNPNEAFNEKITELADLAAKMKRVVSEKGDLTVITNRIRHIKEELTAIEHYYRFPVTCEQLVKIADILKCDVILGVGIDRANILSKNDDRTVEALTARFVLSEETSLYLLAGLYISKKMATLDVLTGQIQEWEGEFGYISKIAIESYQGEDLHLWAVESGYESELVYPSYKSQFQMFNLFCMVMKAGLYKAPPVPYWTDDNGLLHDGFTTKDDILREEMASFEHNEARKLFGSPDKKKKGGVKDDVIYGAGLSIHATHGENISRGSGLGGGKGGYPSAIPNENVVGNY